MQTLTIYCLCADWCQTCHAYMNAFEILKQRNSDNVCWIWVDIEDNAELLDDVDVVSFPCLLVADTQHVYFFGPILPHLAVATQLVDRALERKIKPINIDTLQSFNQRLIASEVLRRV